jgi:hypothetical protein
MIYIPIIILIIILLLDFYLTYEIRFKGATQTEPFNQTDEIVRFKDPNPWNKVIYQDKENKYYLKIKNINKYINKIMLWKQLPTVNSEMIDIDIEKNYLIIKSKDEAEALVNTNLLLSYINDELDPDEVLGKKFIPSSIRKAKKHKLVATKLTELIKENIKILNKSNKKIETNDEEEEIDNKNIPGLVNPNVIVSPTGISIEQPNINNIVNNIEPMVKHDLPLEMFSESVKIMPYEGTEYASVRFGGF